MVELDFAPSAVESEALVVDVEGYEGPLDLLLALAKAQKVDLAKISILALAEQYLSFIGDVRKVRLEIAADYLVMAAWLAFLKSRLLLPEEESEEGPSGEELAARLAFRLQRLQAMRKVGAALMARNLLGREVFQRGDPEGITVTKSSNFEASLYDLLSAYATRRTINAARTVQFRRLPVWSVKDARERLERMVGSLGDWQPLDALLIEYVADPDLRPSVIASSFTATLELAREGEVEMRQAQHYEPLYIRRRQSA
ncbi:MAG: segregation/condensation protein A, partial [Rhizobiales bacterium]|nr:segregation/condensation protein A [Hyphomicrobiales bacterium]